MPAELERRQKPVGTKPPLTMVVGVAEERVKPLAEAVEPATPAAPKRRVRRKRRFTKTQEALLRYVAGETALHGGACCTKRDLADMFGRSVKTIDRSIADLRREGVIEVEMRFDKTNGAQLSSVYRVNFDAMTS